MKTLFFSIILPVKDSEETLPWLIHSVRKQQFTEWELIAVDDMSTDGSRHLLSKYATKDRRIRVCSSPGEGIVDALNTGLSIACGRWTVRVDADDICHPELLSELYRNIQNNPSISVHAAQIRYFPRLSLQMGLRTYESWINSLTDHEEIVRDMFIECPMPHPTLTCSLDELTSVGTYRDKGWPEDYDLILRFWQKGLTFSKVDRVLYFWRDTQDRLSRTHSNYTLEKFMEAKIEFLQKSYLSGGKEAAVAGAGPVGKAFAQQLMARGVKVKAFLEVNPSKIGKEIHGAEVLSVYEARWLRGTIILHAVGQKDTREEARKLYRKLGLFELKDFLFVS
jgi:glycosyltransferase involved in cell wall biosynthesis